MDTALPANNTSSRNRKQASAATDSNNWNHSADSSFEAASVLQSLSTAFPFSSWRPKLSIVSSTNVTTVTSTVAGTDGQSTSFTKTTTNSSGPLLQNNSERLQAHTGQTARPSKPAPKKRKPLREQSKTTEKSVATSTDSSPPLDRGQVAEDDHLLESVPWVPEQNCCSASRASICVDFPKTASPRQPPDRHIAPGDAEDEARSLLPNGAPNSCDKQVSQKRKTREGRVRSRAESERNTGRSLHDQPGSSSQPLRSRRKRSSSGKNHSQSSFHIYKGPTATFTHQPSCCSMHPQTQTSLEPPPTSQRTATDMNVQILDRMLMDASRHQQYLNAQNHSMPLTSSFSCAGEGRGTPSTASTSPSPFLPQAEVYSLGNLLVHVFYADDGTPLFLRHELLVTLNISGQMFNRCARRIRPVPFSFCPSLACMYPTFSFYRADDLVNLIADLPDARSYPKEAQAYMDLIFQKAHIPKMNATKSSAFRLY